MRDLIRSFAIEPPRAPTIPPAWDLNIVLRHLISEAYEPLSSKPLRGVTMKVLFLVSLATVKRVGELHALSRKVAFRGRNQLGIPF